MIKLEQRRDLGQSQGGSGSIFWKFVSSWHSELADLYEGSNCGENLGTVSSSLVYITGYWTGHHIWAPWLASRYFFIAIDCIVDHSTGTSVDKKTFPSSVCCLSQRGGWPALSQNHFQIYCKLWIFDGVHQFAPFLLNLLLSLMKHPWRGRISPRRTTFWTSCLPQPSSHKSILPPEACAAYATLWSSLLPVNLTGQRGRGRGHAIGKGNAGRLSGIKHPLPTSRESWPGLRSCEGGYDAVWLHFACLFSLFFLCALVTPVSRLQRSRQNFRSPTSDQIPFGIQTTS